MSATTSSVQRGPRALSMLPNSLALIAAKVATLGLGFLFWVLAARLFAPREVGLAGGIVSAVMLCTQLALLGAGAAVIALFPRYASSPAPLLNTAVNLVAGSSALIGGAFVVLATVAFPRLAVVGSSPIYVVLFVSMSVFGTLAILLDQVSTTLRRGDEALGRGTLNGVLSLVWLGALGLSAPRATSMSIFACWVVGGAAACILGAIQLRIGATRYRWRPRFDRRLGGRMVLVGLPNHVLTLADRAPALVLPIFVTELLSPRANAYWYAVWMMAWVVFVVPVQVGMTLFSEASHRPAAIGGLVRHGMRIGLGIGLFAAGLLAAVAPVLLSLMGAGYAGAGTAALRILVWGVAPAVVIQMYYARSRAVNRLWEAIATSVASGTLSVAAAVISGVHWGLTAMAASWVGAQSLAAAWAGWRLRRLGSAADGQNGDVPHEAGTVASWSRWVRRAGPAMVALRSRVAPDARRVKPHLVARAVEAAADYGGSPSAVAPSILTPLQRRTLTDRRVWMTSAGPTVVARLADGTWDLPGALRRACGPDQLTRVRAVHQQGESTIEPSAPSLPLPGHAPDEARQRSAGRLRVRAWQRATAILAQRPRSGNFVAVLVLVVALLAWFQPLSQVDLRGMSAIGLISVIPSLSLLGLGLVCASFVVQLRRARTSQPLLLLHVVALAVMLFAVTAFIEPEPRFAVAWRHVGIISAIQQSGVIRTTFDAYFNWPGFFAASAFVAHAAGLHNLLPLTPWAPLAFELLALAPLLLIMRALTTNVRLQWSAIFIFYLANWVGQDYFSPQAFAYVLYLTVVGVLLTWLRGSDPRRPPWKRLHLVSPPHGRSPRLTPRARGGLVAMTVLIMVAVIASHQLTPYALLPGVAVLVFLRRCEARGLPLMIAMMLAFWLCYLATGYLSGHSAGLLGGIGSVGSTFHAAVGSRVHGAGGHVLVTTVQIGTAAALWILAALGAWRRARHGHDDVSALALAGGSFILPLLQPYGGEILLRVFLFSLPFTAFFVAGLFCGNTAARPAFRTIAVFACFGIALAAAQLLVRYGNEQMDWFSPGDVAAAEHLYAAAPAGSTLVAWSPSLPWKYRDYTEHHYRVVTQTPDWISVSRLPAASAAQLAALAGRMRGQRAGAYLILTRSQAAQVDLTGVSPPGTVERLIRALSRSRMFRLLYANSDGAVFTAQPRAHPRGTGRTRPRWTWLRPRPRVRRRHGHRKSGAHQHRSRSRRRA